MIKIIFIIVLLMPKCGKKITFASLYKVEIF